MPVSSDSSSPARNAGPAQRGFPVRARQLLSSRGLWLFPLIVGPIMLILITVFYMGSVADPIGHLHGLPVAVVNSDRGTTIGTRRIDIGQKVQAGLSHAAAVSGKLALTDTTLAAAEQGMDRGAYYAAVVIPAGFTASLLHLAGVHAGGTASAKPEIVILTNQRAGTTAVSLATSVLQPALEAASGQIGRQLGALLRAPPSSPLTRAFLADPITATTVQYHPLPSHAALGLSAFYTALLMLMCGFLGGIIVHNSVDVALGYATSEIGPRWSQRRPVPINRWQTLLIKWVMVVPVTGLMTGLMIIFATGILRMDAPYPWLLWLVGWLAAVSVAEGTVVLFAVLGAPGQLLAMLLFVYAGLASAGGTIPVQALPSWLSWLAQVEPLRQILSGTRAILYFGARADAGLARSVIAAASGLAFWLIAGAVLVRWYDRKGLNRMSPELLAYVRASAEEYKAQDVAAKDDKSGSLGGPADRS
jgi:YhgE/Pip-like protein